RGSAEQTCNGQRIPFRDSVKYLAAEIVEVTQRDAGEESVDSQMRRRDDPITVRDREKPEQQAGYKQEPENKGHCATMPLPSNQAKHQEREQEVEMLLNRQGPRMPQER